MAMESIDLILLKQAGQVVPQPVLDALERQGQVSLHLHVISGERFPTDRNRWDTICRARNRAKSLGTSPAVMFLDSDVVLPDKTIEQLVAALQQDAKLAAVAADYLGEAGRQTLGHVGMGATLFRRDVLNRVTFRWENQKCECLCCCEDLRRSGWRIEYLSDLKAMHLNPRRQADTKHGTQDARQGVSHARGKTQDVYTCPACGTQYLVAVPCCGAPTVEKPVLFYSLAQSPHRFHDIAFSVIMPTKNNVALTRAAVRSLLKDCPTEQVEFIFVDSGSTDETMGFLRGLALRYQVKLIVAHPREPFVYARANNRGARAAAGKFLLFVNNDIEVLSQKPYDLLRKALDNPKVGAAGVTWFDEWHKRYREQIQQDMKDGCWLGNLPVPGYFWAVRREVYWEVGGMDEAFSGYGHDEVEMQYRLVKAHYRLALLDVEVRHADKATYRQERTPQQMNQLWEENVARFRERHGRPPTYSDKGVEPFISHKSPVISVAIATRNYGRFLRRCLDSVLACRNPTDAPLQVVVVDNASTDDTPLILHDYKQKHPDVFNLIRLHHQNSAAAAKNAAMDRCIGKYVALLDADDEFLPDKLEACYQTLEQTSCDVVTHDFLVRTPQHPTPFPAAMGFSEAALRALRPPSAWMFRNGAVRFNEQMVGGAEDLEWYLRRWHHLRAVHISRPLFIYQRHPQQLSQATDTATAAAQMMAPLRRPAR
jgi:glycosyltransferase involved in cell wall biosynthesis